MTEEEFRQQYIKRMGRIPEICTVLPCRCGDESCQGWQVLPKDLAAEPLIRHLAGIE